ncbi:MAG: hypothetical protein JXM79_20665 [Sedimentisphaerales bacterium]|nr:hypothetical protein [Sedimentisphaerales bacterium]
MEKQQIRMSIVLLVLCCVAIAGCGKKEDEPKEQTPTVAQTPPPPPPRVPNAANPEQMREYLKQQMAQMEAKTKVMNAKTAYAMALPEAKKWNAQAKLYEIEGEKKLTPDGTAAMWTAHFATQTDTRDTPSEKQGKKCTVLMSDGEVVRVYRKETPEDISYAAECYAFLPEERLNSTEAIAKCLAALKDKHGAGVDNAELTRLIYTSRENDAGYQPVWELNASVNGSSATVVIDAATGEVI